MHHICIQIHIYLLIQLKKKTIYNFNVFVFRVFSPQMMSILLNRASDDSYKIIKCLNIGSFGSPVSMCFFWQWTRSTTWHLQLLLPTTCTIQLKHWRPTPSALLTCLVSAHSHSCWVEIWIGIGIGFFFFFLVTFSKPLCVFQGLAKRVGARLLLASTSEVYGGKRDFAQSSLSAPSPSPPLLITILSFLTSQVVA